MAFMGMRGTGDWPANVRPESFRETILRLYPNGDAPLTAILSKMSSESVNDPVFHWFSKNLPLQRLAVTGVYTNPGLSSAYTSGGIAGSTIYLKGSAAQIGEFGIRHQVLMRTAADLTNDVNGIVTAKEINGASSYIAVKLLEADDNSTQGKDLSDCDTALIIGRIQPEGAQMPDAIAYDTTELQNQTQIFETPLEITRTAQLTRLRTGDAYKEAKREALELHSIEMEKAFWWGKLTTGAGSNGKPQRSMMGIIDFIRQNNPAGIVNYTLDTGYSGQSWLVGGEDWIDTNLEIAFRFGAREKLGMCGSGFVAAINKLAKQNGNIWLDEKTTSYGLQIMRWITPFGVLNLMMHPLFTYETTNRNMCAIFEPKNIRYRYISDTFFNKDDTQTSGGQAKIDGRKESYLTECSGEYHFPETWTVLQGAGQANVV